MITLELTQVQVELGEVELERIAADALHELGLA